MQHELPSEKMFLPLTHPGIEGVRTTYVPECCCTLDAIEFDMQHDHVLKKFNFDILTGVRGSADKLFATMLLHGPFL